MDGIIRVQKKKKVVQWLESHLFTLWKKENIWDLQVIGCVQQRKLINDLIWLILIFNFLLDKYTNQSNQKIPERLLISFLCPTQPIKNHVLFIQKAHLKILWFRKSMCSHVSRIVTVRKRICVRYSRIDKSIAGHNIRSFLCLHHTLVVHGGCW